MASSTCQTCGATVYPLDYTCPKCGAPVGDKPSPQVASSPETVQRPPPFVTPDGKWWWDGQQWQPLQTQLHFTRPATNQFTGAAARAAGATAWSWGYVLIPVLVITALIVVAALIIAVIMPANPGTP